MDSYFDISPEIHEGIAVYPGDTPYTRRITQSFARGNACLLSHIMTTPHVGAHVDAPNHYHQDGSGISERSLHYYLGPCQVLSVNAARGTGLRPQDVNIAQVNAPRLLLRTQSFPDPETWNNDFNALTPELVDALHACGVILIGIDTPSVDLFDAKPLHSHQRIFHHDMAILEGIDLTDVPDGAYILSALPLRLRDADASPVRAVLWKN